jgi:hypothetical protein
MNGKCRRKLPLAPIRVVWFILSTPFGTEAKFDEPNDDWLDAIEATSDELLGAYSRIADEAMTIVFSARGKCRLIRVFDVIGFVYPDYCFPARRQGEKRKLLLQSLLVRRSRKGPRS